MDILKLATDLAGNMSQDDKDVMENLDMEQMISHVTQNVFKMMGNMGNNSEDSFDFSSLLKQKNPNHEPNNEPINESNDESDTEPEEMLKTRDICFELNVDLEDFYTGKKKKLNVKRKRIIESGGKQRVVEEKKKIIISIEKGMKDEQQIRFKGEADQIPGFIPGDIIVTLIENEHSDFQRDGDNLIIVKNIDLYQNYNITFDIKHLDNRILRIVKEPSDALHLNDSLRKINDEGMPIYKSQELGDLFIRFNLVIPKSIDIKYMDLLKDIFETEIPKLEETYTKQCTLENISEEDLEEFSSDSDDSSSNNSTVTSVSTDSE